MGNDTDRFTLRFLEDLGYKSTNDRLYIGLLKALGLIDANGIPTQRYFAFLDDSQWRRVIAEGMQEAYEDLYRLNREAHRLSKAQLLGKLKSLTEGKKSASVLDNMARTFKELAKLGDFTTTKVGVVQQAQDDAEPSESIQESPVVPPPPPRVGVIPPRQIEGLTYRIEIVLPSARDKEVYDAIFRSIREHLL